MQKGEVSPLQVIGSAILVFIVVFISIYIFIGPSQRIQTTVTDTLESLNDPACLAQGILTKVSQKNDIDSDKRPDNTCDVCVCEKLCPNGKDSNNENDENGNRIPDGCEDPNDKEDPWYFGCKKEDRDNAFADKNPGNIIVLNKAKHIWQCRLSGPGAAPLKQKPVLIPSPKQATSKQQSTNEVMNAYLLGLRSRLNIAETKGTLTKEKVLVSQDIQDTFSTEFKEDESEGISYYSAFNEALLLLHKDYGDKEAGSAKNILALTPVKYQDEFIVRSGSGKQYVLHQEIIDILPSGRWKEPNFSKLMAERGYKQTPK